MKKNDVGIMESVFCTERDNLKIRGTEYRRNGENLPIAIVSHGFMAFQDTVRHYAKFLAKLGFAAYCFDFCGGCVIKGKSDGKTIDMSVLTEVQDLEAVLEYTKNLSYTDATRILLMGCSQGGFVSAITASKHSNEIHKLVLFYPAFCIPDDARRGRMMFARFDPNNIPGRIQCGPMKLGKCYVEDVINMDPNKEISNYTSDVLLVHGTHDSIVATDYIERAYKMYLNNRDTLQKDYIVSLHMIEGAKHSFTKRYDEIAMKYLEEFIEDMSQKAEVG